MSYRDEDDSSKGIEQIHFDVSLLTLLLRVYFYQCKQQ